MKMIYGIGVGPGDPELLTVKAVKLLQQAHTVFVPCHKGASLAKQIIAQYLDGHHCVEIAIPMGEDNQVRYQQAAFFIETTLPDGTYGVYATLGDPLLYSTFGCLMPYLIRQGLQVQLIPGISGYQAAASLVNCILAKKSERVAIVEGDLEESVAINAETICVFKPNRNKARILDLLDRHGFQYVYVKRCSMPEQAVLTYRTEILQDQDYLAILLATRCQGRFIIDRNV